MSRKSRRKSRSVRAATPSPAKPADAPKRAEIRAAGGAATIAAATGEDGKPKLPTFTGRAYTGQAMRPEGWWKPVVIDLAGVKVPSQHRPALRQHDHNQIVGHTTAVTVSDEGIDVEGVFSGERQHAAKVTEPAANGFQWQLSVGANPICTEELDAGKETEVNGRTVVGPLTISRETELGEISFVPLGADGDTSATVSASRGRGRPMNAKAMLKASGTYSAEEVDAMTDEEAKAALKKCMKADDDEDDEDDEDDTDLEDEPPAKAKAGRKPAIKGGRRPSIKAAAKAAVDEAIKASRAAAAAETRRQNTIRARVTRYAGINAVECALDSKGKPADGAAKQTIDLVAHAIEYGWTADEAELVALRCARPGPGVGGPLVYSTTTPDVSAAVIEAAVLDAARHQFKLDDDDFYTQPTPDGKGVMRRMPGYLEREARTDFRAGGRYTDQVRQAAHTQFRGRISPRQILDAAFRQWGHRSELDLTGEHGVRAALAAWHHYEQQHAIRADGASYLSISNVLANVLNKFALQGYLFVEQAWREICAIRPVNDFKPSKSINLLGDVMFQKFGPSGELEHAAITDQAFANQAAPYGRILTIPWTLLVNDDLGMLTGAPMKIGQGAGLALNDNIWTLWANMASGSVNGDDGVAFWRTTSDVTSASKKTGKAYRPNKTSGGSSALSPTSLQVVKALFDNQVDPNGNPLGFDGLTPILLHGPSNWQTATALLQAAALVYGGASAALQPDKNVWQGMLKPVMSRYVENANYVNSATAFWVLFNPVALAAIEVCFLNGVDTPAVLQAGPDYQFDRLGISIRGTMPFGSTQQNFRGGVYSVGA